MKGSQPKAATGMLRYGVMLLVALALSSVLTANAFAATLYTTDSKEAEKQAKAQTQEQTQVKNSGSAFKSTQNATYSTSTSVKSNAASSAVAMMRLFNPKTGEHLYTKDQNERKVLTSKRGWKYEGIAWYSPERSYTPVYRVFNPKTGEHFYTSDVYERKVLLLKKGWVAEGVGWFSSDAKEVAISRLYNKKTKAVASHHYTKDANEVNHLTKGSWKKEGVAWYGVHVVFGNPSASRFYERQTGGACESYAAAFAINAALNRKAISGKDMYNFRVKYYPQNKNGGNANNINKAFIDRYFKGKLNYMGFDEKNASPQLLADLIKNGWMVEHCTSSKAKVFRKADGKLHYNVSSSGHDICFYAYNEKTRTFYANDSTN